MNYRPFQPLGGMESAEFYSINCFADTIIAAQRNREVANRGTGFKY